jgi:alpha-tubulin suppressor-like RCC1 family protein
MNTPQVMTGFSSGGGIQVTCGYYHTCVLNNVGGVLCVGWNANFQLGTGNNTDLNLLFPVLGLNSGVVTIAAGGAHTCALLYSSVVCWGLGTFGQLGNSVTASSAVYVQVTGLTSGIQMLGYGYFFSCAINVIGVASCWGQNPNGALGDGTSTDTNYPVNMTGLSQAVISEAGGIIHSCVSTLSTVYCYGYNGNGQVGSPNTGTNFFTPYDVFPTQSPTNSPTYVPSNLPTIQPTLVPTTNPTLEPTNNPTVVPTNKPTSVPTLQPIVGSDCFPRIATSKKECTLKLQRCGMKWTKRGCRYRGVVGNDGGCQCLGYCNYSCSKACKKDKEFVNGSCSNKVTGEIQSVGMCL